MTTITEISAYLFWSMIVASIAYQLKDFDTPFTVSLTQHQINLQYCSSKKRGQFYCIAYVLSFLVIYFIFKYCL